MTDLKDQAGAVSAARDSMTVAAWTIISRVTGVIRFAVIAAVLGPTFFGNTYQFTNSLPNLLYYGLLAGSLFSSLLVPALVRHIDAHDQRASERIAGPALRCGAVRQPYCSNECQDKDDDCTGKT